jgi:hypothetical protein
MDSELELLRRHEEELTWVPSSDMLPGTEIPFRQAEPRLHARLERSNITMHVTAANAKLPTISRCLLPASHRKCSSASVCFTFVTTDAVSKIAFILALHCLHALRARGKL